MVSTKLLHLFRLFSVDVGAVFVRRRRPVASCVVGDAAAEEQRLVGDLEDEVGPAYVEHLQYKSALGFCR